VVDLLELRLLGADLVVLVGRIRAPIAARREDLDRDQPVGLETVGRGEVADFS
jgi:hypothetical protein